MDQALSPKAPSRSRTSRSALFFALSLVLLVTVSLFAGAMLRPALDRLRQPRVMSGGDIAAFLEHVALDVSLGRAAQHADRLKSLATETTDPVLRERVLALWTEATLQGGRLSDAANSEEQREGIVSPGDARNTVRLRRISLASALGQSARADELAAPLITGGDPRLADEARIRLLSSMKQDELRAWVAKTGDREPEETRRAGLAALRLLGDTTQAERHLGSLERSGQRDPSICEALIEAYRGLGRPRDLVRIIELLIPQARNDDERTHLILLHASALAQIDETGTALGILEPLRSVRDPQVRELARRSRYEILKRAGRLQSEIESLREPEERAYVALEVKRDYAEAVRLYRTAVAAHPDSEELARRLREAERRRELAERRALYEQVLAKDHGDHATQEKLLAVLVALSESETVRQLIGQMLKGREQAPEALIGVALALRRAGLGRDAAEYLGKALTAETDTAKKQQIMVLLGDLYAEARRGEDARRLYTTVAADGASPAVRELAVGRLVSMLR